MLLFAGLSIYIESNKNQLLSKLKDGLSKNINGKISYSKADISVWKHFPFIGLHLYDVDLSDSLNAPLLNMKEASIKVSVLQYFNNKTELRNLSLKNGFIHIYTDSSGYSNKYLLGSSNKDSTKPRKLLELNNAVLENVQIVLENRQKNKKYEAIFKELDADINTAGDVVTIELEEKAIIKGLGFNLTKGSYLKDQTFDTDIKLKYNKSKSHLSFGKSKIIINEQPYEIKGDFWLAGVGSFKLDVETVNAPFNKLQKIFADNIYGKLQNVQIHQPIDVTAQLQGSLGYKTIPKVTAAWKVKNNTLTTSVASFTNVSFDGTFNNEYAKGSPLTDENSAIVISGFKGNWEGIQLNGQKIIINNLVQPNFNMNLQSSTDLKSLNDKLGLRSIQFLSGNASLSFQYNGPLINDISLINKLNGNLNFTNGTIKYLPRNFTFKNCSGNIIFSEDQVRSNNMKFDLGSNKFTVNIAGTNLSGLSSNDVSQASIQCKVYTPELNVAELKTLFAGKTRVAFNKKKGNIITSAGKIDETLDHGKLQLFLNAGVVRYNNFIGHNLSGNVLFTNNDLHLSNVSINHAKGKLIVNADVKENRGKHSASANVKLQNVDVSKVFHAFDDFGQDGISHKNLNGNLTANTNVMIDIDNKGNIVPGTMNGFVDFSLKNGSLINYEPIQNIKNFVLKKRDMSNLSFAELKNKIEIKNNQVTIPRMEIQSSEIALFVEGLYDLKKKDSKIDIQVPLKGLKKRDSTYIPKNIGVNTKAGTSIYLEGKNDKNGNVKFGLNTTRTIRKLF